MAGGGIKMSISDYNGDATGTNQQDWRISPKQTLFIQDRIRNLSKHEASILIKIIEALYQSRPSSQENKNAE